MTDPDFNLLVALDILLTEESVAGGAPLRSQRLGDEPHPDPSA